MSAVFKIFRIVGKYSLALFKSGYHLDGIEAAVAKFYRPEFIFVLFRPDIHQILSFSLIIVSVGNI